MQVYLHVLSACRQSIVLRAEIPGCAKALCKRREGAFSLILERAE